MALRYGADLPAVEVAAILDLDPGTVRAHLHAARTRLSAVLSVDADDPPERNAEPTDPDRRLMPPTAARSTTMKFDEWTTEAHRSLREWNPDPAAPPTAPTVRHAPADPITTTVPLDPVPGRGRQPVSTRRRLLAAAAAIMVIAVAAAVLVATIHPGRYRRGVGSADRVRTDDR